MDYFKNSKVSFLEQSTNLDYDGIIHDQAFNESFHQKIHSK